MFIVYKKQLGRLYKTLGQSVSATKKNQFDTYILKKTPNTRVNQI